MYSSHYHFLHGKPAPSGWLLVTHLVGVGVQTWPFILTTLLYSLRKNELTAPPEACPPI